MSIGKRNQQEANADKRRLREAEEAEKLIWAYPDETCTGQKVQVPKSCTKWSLRGRYVA